jgi:hypothetical protein
MTDQTAPTGVDPAAFEPPSRSQQVLKEILGGNAMISVLAVVLAMVVGAILIAFTDDKVQAAAGYFFSRPADTFAAIWDAVAGAYSALFQGSIYNFRRRASRTASARSPRRSRSRPRSSPRVSAWRSRSARACSTSVVVARWWSPPAPRATSGSLGRCRSASTSSSPSRRA